MPFSVTIASQQTVGRDIEGRVARGRARRRNRLSGNLQLKHFCGTALFDRDQVAMRQREIDGGSRDNRINRHMVIMGRQSQHIGADLIGDIAVSGHPVGAKEDLLHLARAAENSRPHCR